MSNEPIPQITRDEWRLLHARMERLASLLDTTRYHFSNAMERSQYAEDIRVMMMRDR